MAERGTDGNMVATPADFEFEIGSPNPIGPEEDPVIAAQMGIQLKPGQRMGQWIKTDSGQMIPTTIFNMLPSDPRAEAKYGKKEYNPKKNKQHPNELMKTIDALTQKMEIMEAKMGAGMNNVNAKDAEIEALKAELAKLKEKGTEVAKTQTRCRTATAKGRS